MLAGPAPLRWQLSALGGRRRTFRRSRLTEPLQTQTAGDGPAACAPQPTLAGGIENRLRGVGTAIPDLCHNERSEPVDVTGYSRSRGTRLRLDRL